MQMLKGRVAVVTGASRGAGRGIALALGEAGATVYVTGRSSRGHATENLPGSIDETAEAVTARGGRGIPVRCDHTVDEEVQALFGQVRHENGHLDLLVNNAWGGYAGMYDGSGWGDGTQFDAPFWQQSLSRWDGMFTAVSRAAFALSHDFAPHGIAAIALTPGFMRTERTTSAGAIKDLSKTESPEYIGRAVVALATDPTVMEKSGQTLATGDLAQEYGFTDVDGRQLPPCRV